MVTVELTTTDTDTAGSNARTISIMFEFEVPLQDMLALLKVPLGMLLHTLVGLRIVGSVWHGVAMTDVFAQH